MHTEAGDGVLSAMCYSLGLTISPLIPLTKGRASRWPSRTEPSPRALGADLWAGWKRMRASQVVFEMLCLQGQHGVLLLPQGEVGNWEPGKPG